MALLVANRCSERFTTANATSPPIANSSDNSKVPPPKKKWIQAYLEKTTEHSAVTSSSSTGGTAAAAAVFGSDDDDLVTAPDGQLPSEVIGDVVQDVIDQFQDYIDVTNQRNHNSSSSLYSTGNNSLAYLRSDARRTAEAEQMARLLYPSHNSRKFTEGLQRLSMNQPMAAGPLCPGLPPAPVYRNSSSNYRRQEALVAAVEPPQPEEFSKEDIGGVVQTVISQFLNGDLAEHSSLFRRSRRHKRRHRRPSASGGKSKDERATAAAAEEDEDGPSSAKFARFAAKTITTTQEAEELVEADENGVLNLSLPKQQPAAAAAGLRSLTSGPRVTFALEDKCYGEDGNAQFFLASKGGCKIISPSSVPESQAVAAAAANDNIGAVIRKYAAPPVVVRPGVIATPLAVTGVHLLQQQNAGPAAVLPLSSCAHFAGDGGGDVAAAAAPTYLTKPASYISSSSSKPFTFSSVIRPLPTALLTSKPSSTSDTPPALTAKASAGDAKVKPATAKTASPTKSASATSSRRQVIVKPGAVDKEKSADAIAASEPSVESAAATANGGSGTNREMHNRLEKNRRAHLKACFDELASECELDARKASNLTVIKTALKTIMGLRRKEREHEKELADLVQQKIRRQQLLAQLTAELPSSTTAAVVAAAATAAGPLEDDD